MNKPTKYLIATIMHAEYYIIKYRPIVIGICIVLLLAIIF